ncbi:MAG TPA: RNA methyltransferase [Polyangiaceae bacterium]|nr:RNA methyltransferase [Polyangiaceae bacterium]
MIRVLEPFAEERRRARMLEVTRQRVGSVTLLMDMPRDPHNGAAVVRSADAFGVPEVHAVLREEAFVVGHRVAQGAERWVEVIPHRAPDDAVRALRERGFRLVATHPKGALVPADLAALDRVCLVLGNEHDGISEALTAAADDSVRIPMRGYVESLNLSVAAAVLLAAAVAGRKGDLGPTDERRLYAVGLFRSVPRADEILRALAPC